MKTFVAVLVYLLFLFNLIDYFTTDILLQHGYTEANPFMNWVIETHGMFGVLLFKMTMMLIILEILFEYYEGNATQRAIRMFFFGMVAVNILYAVVVTNNMILYIDVVKQYLT